MAAVRRPKESTGREVVGCKATMEEGQLTVVKQPGEEERRGNRLWYKATKGREGRGGAVGFFNKATREGWGVAVGGGKATRELDGGGGNFVAVEEAN